MDADKIQSDFQEFENYDTLTDTETVSYTHLDVYKRQLLVSPNSLLSPSSRSGVPVPSINLPVNVTPRKPLPAPPPDEQDALSSPSSPPPLPPDRQPLSPGRKPLPEVDVDEDEYD